MDEGKSGLTLSRLKIYTFGVDLAFLAEPPSGDFLGVVGMELWHTHTCRPTPTHPNFPKKKRFGVPFKSTPYLREKTTKRECLDTETGVSCWQVVGSRLLFFWGIAIKRCPFSEISHAWVWVHCWIAFFFILVWTTNGQRISRQHLKKSRVKTKKKPGKCGQQSVGGGKFTFMPFDWIFFNKKRRTKEATRGGELVYFVGGIVRTIFFGDFLSSWGNKKNIKTGREKKTLFKKTAKKTMEAKHGMGKWKIEGLSVS